MTVEEFLVALGALTPVSFTIGVYLGAKFPGLVLRKKAPSG